MGAEQRVQAEAFGDAAAQHGFVHQGGQQRERNGGDLLGCLRAEITLEDRQFPVGVLFFGAEVKIAPLQGRPHVAVFFGQILQAGLQQFQVVGERQGELFAGGFAQGRRCQLNTERVPLQLLADAHDGGDILRGGLKAGLAVPGARQEQLHRTAVHHLLRFTLLGVIQTL